MQLKYLAYKQQRITVNLACTTQYYEIRAQSLT
jgi:hypothetical protein